MLNLYSKELPMKKNTPLPPLGAAEQQRYIGAIRAENDRIFEASERRPGAFVQTFGCQQNEADSEKFAGMCEEMGYAIVADPADADFIVVNTCAIREHAEKRTLSIVGQYKHLKEKNPALVIAVCGCMMAQEHRQNDIKFRYPYVDFVMGPSSLHRLPQLLVQKLKTGKTPFSFSPLPDASCVS